MAQSNVVHQYLVKCYNVLIFVVGNPSSMHEHTLVILQAHFSGFTTSSLTTVHACIIVIII